MLSSQSPILNNSIQNRRSDRKALQPKNSPATPIINDPKIKSKKTSSFFIQVDITNKENVPPFYQYASPVAAVKIEPLKMEPLDSSLAEELSAIRKKMERLKLDKEKTEKILIDREALLDMHMKDLIFRGEIQKQFETEVDRLYRLQEIKRSCMISSIKSLREKEQLKKDSRKPLTGSRGDMS